MRGLYAIVDLDQLGSAGLDPVAFTEAVVVARPSIVQLRAKNASPRDTLSLLRALRPLCSGATALFANDRPDLAVAAGCDGVHVGQDDLDVSDVRRFAPGLKVGVSTHTEAQLKAALAERPDYVAFGPVFSTRSKAEPDAVVGLEGLERAARLSQAAGCPLVAIGGIDAPRLAQVARHAQGVAVIGALLPSAERSDDPAGRLAEVRQRTAELQQAIAGAVGTPIANS